MDITTLLASQGKFACVSVEVDLYKPLNGGIGCAESIIDYSMGACMIFALGVAAMDIGTLHAQ